MQKKVQGRSEDREGQRIWGKSQEEGVRLKEGDTQLHTGRGEGRGAGQEALLGARMRPFLGADGDLGVLFTLPPGLIQELWLVEMNESPSSGVPGEPSQSWEPRGLGSE